MPSSFAVNAGYASLNKPLVEDRRLQDDVAPSLLLYNAIPAVVLEPGGDLGQCHLAVAKYCHVFPLLGIANTCTLPRRDPLPTQWQI